MLCHVILRTWKQSACGEQATTRTHMCISSENVVLIFEKWDSPADRMMK